ncbi:acetate--CoA ligase family protein [Candidatus Woesearchaeota archaeon]|nr:acetate--CoA ligase family protein [Candidatus Woesearchaeota archaeon]
MAQATAAGTAPSKPVAFSKALALLRGCGVDFCETALVGNEEEALAAASKLGFPVFLKDVSVPACVSAVHKYKAGLVLRADGQESLAKAYGSLEAAHGSLVKKRLLEKKLTVAIQKEVSGIECLVGAKRDPSFGCIVLFGSGGISAEELGDVTLRLCPIGSAEAELMIKGTRVYSRISKLKGNGLLLRKLADAVAAVSNLIEGHPEISELDMNPLLVDESQERVVAVDARMVYSASKKLTGKNKRAAATKKGKPADWKSAAVSRFFGPASIALLGASRDKESVGQAIMRNLTLGCVHRCEYCRPFFGKIFPVNPFATEILGIKCYPSITAVPEPVDIAIIALPSHLVLGAVEECIKKKTKAAIIISAGFGEFNEEGKRLQLKIAEKLEKAGILLLGPNCLGIIRPQNNLNASFAPSTPPRGNIAFVSQSGALADSVIDWSIQARYGFSSVISYGNKAMLDCYDFFDFLATDEETRAVAIYLEGVNSGSAFFERLKALVAKKPVVILKGGRTGSGMAAAATHTASLAGDARIFEAAVRQSGAVLVDTVEELFDLAKVLAEQPVCEGNGIGVITNGGGCGVICSDYCEELGVKLPQLQKGILKAFDKSGIMHPAYSRRNPLDIVGDALPDRYGLAASALLEEPYIHGLIVIQTMQAMTNPVLDAKVIVDAHRQFQGKPIISCFMGGRFSKKGMHYLDNMHIPDFNDIRKAVVAMKALIDRGEFMIRLQKAEAAAASAAAGATVTKGRKKRKQAGKRR